MSTTFGRRHVLGIGVTTIAGTLAGCIGGDASAEVDELADSATLQLDQSVQSIEAGFELSDGEDWSTCQSELDGVPDELTVARDDAEEARQLAESDGLEDRANAMGILVTYIDLMIDLAEELHALCEAGMAEDYDAVEDRSATIDSLSEELDATERDLNEAFHAVE